MSVASKVQSSVKPVGEPLRAILGPTGNRVRVLDESKKKPEVVKSRPKKKPADMPQSAVKNNLSVDSSCSTDSSSSSRSSSSSGGGAPAKVAGSRKMALNSKRSAVRPVQVVPAAVNGDDAAEASPKKQDGPAKRCDWITPNSDPLYSSFHDEEWGVPVHDDRKLFELLVFSQALAELSWPAILHMRDIFRKFFADFDPSSIAQFDDKKLLSLKVNGNLLLSEPKLRAIVENSKLVLKVQKEFGSFSNYCWRFVNHKTLTNGHRYARQVPVKTPKAELISKDLMQRGFRCVGPTVVYSFMQVAGIVNDHLVTCFRHEECTANGKKNLKPKIEDTEVVTKALEN